MKRRLIRRFNFKFLSLITLIVLKIIIIIIAIYLFGKVLWEEKNEINFLDQSNKVEGFSNVSFYLFGGILVLPIHIIILIIISRLTNYLNIFYTKNKRYRLFRLFNKGSLFIYSWGIIVLLSAFFSVPIFCYLQLWQLALEGVSLLCFIVLFFIFDKKKIELIANASVDNEQLNWEHDFVVKRKENTKFDMALDIINIASSIADLFL